MPSGDVRFRKSSWASGSQSSEASLLKLAWTTADAAAASAGVRERMVYFIRSRLCRWVDKVSNHFSTGEMNWHGAALRAGATRMAASEGTAQRFIARWARVRVVLASRTVRL